MKVTSVRVNILTRLQDGLLDLYVAVEQQLQITRTALSVFEAALKWTENDENSTVKASDQELSV